MIPESIENLRWDPYFIRSDEEFGYFWSDYLQTNSSNILYILGRGFNPRMCLGINSIFTIEGLGARDCLLICYDEGPNSPSEKQGSILKSNMDTLKFITDKAGEYSEKEIKMWVNEGTGINRRRVGSKVAHAFKDKSELIKYDDIIIDISSMPRGIYFPLITNILKLLDDLQREIGKVTNLHLIVAEDAELDYKIKEIGIDEDANCVYGFSGDLYMESTDGVPKVWFPILGEAKHQQLRRIYNHIRPDEICPVLPSPSSDPRRGDKMMIDYRELIFDEWNVDTKNIIYSNEKNPFETYRQLVRAINYYKKVLEPLNGCRPIISAVTSKLISIGALLTAYDLKSKGINISLVNIEAQGYEITNLTKNVSTSTRQLFTLLLKGEEYDS
mgnify:CR=1 FL=1